MYLLELLGRWRSGQSQQTVNLPTQVYAGSNPALPTICLKKIISTQKVLDFNINLLNM